jgi:uncharacterized membrane protein
MTLSSQTYRWLALQGYFGLLFLLLIWNAILSPPEIMPRSVAIIILVGPLLLPLRGILHGKPYTHAWVSFLALFYFALGVSVAYAVPEERLLGLLEVLFSMLLYGGAIGYVRSTKKKSGTGH